MSLREQLESMKKRSQASARPEVLAVMRRAIEDLRNSGILERAIKVGDRAPNFSLPNASGAIVSSVELLAQGPLVVSFYRGKW